VVAMIACITGIFLTSLVVSGITSIMTGTTKFEQTLQNWLRDIPLRKIAARMIQNKWRQTRPNKDDVEESEERNERKRLKMKKKFQKLRPIPSEPDDQGENRKKNMNVVNKCEEYFDEITDLINDTGRLTREMRTILATSKKNYTAKFKYVPLNQDWE